MKTYLWKIIGLIILGLLVFWFVMVASGAPLHSPKGSEIFPVTNFRIASETNTVPPVPLLPAVTVQFYTNFWYFTVTALLTNLESDYSNEVGLTNIYSDTNNPIWLVALAWDPSPSAATNPTLHYHMYTGTHSRMYTNVTECGTNLTISIAVLPPPLTNCVLTVTTTGTNLYRSTSLKGPWSALNTTNYTATNLPSPYYFRGKGSRGNTVSISSRMQ